MKIGIQNDYGDLWWFHARIIYVQFVLLVIIITGLTYMHTPKHEINPLRLVSSNRAFDAIDVFLPIKIYLCIQHS